MYSLNHVCPYQKFKFKIDWLTMKTAVDSIRKEGNVRRKIFEALLQDLKLLVSPSSKFKELLVGDGTLNSKVIVRTHMRGKRGFGGTSDVKQCPLGNLNSNVQGMFSFALEEKCVAKYSMLSVLPNSVESDVVALNSLKSQNSPAEVK